MKTATCLFSFFLMGSIVTGLNPFETRDSSSLDDDTSYKQHTELGDVHWYRDFEKGRAAAGKSGKPMFVLFQEVPGCQTCQDYGNQPMSHPLVVEAIEDLFVPVVVFNNKQGVDAQILSRFGEKSWNNPVVRYLNQDEQDIISRKDRVWGIGGTVSRMAAALKESGSKIPAFLQLIQLPVDDSVETAEFAMHCYWEGEARLGGIHGVHSTRAGWRDGLEVVQLRFSPAIVDYRKLLDDARSFDCASRVYAHNAEQLRIAKSVVGNKATRATGTMRDAKHADQKYYLSQTIYRHLPLTQLQATKINALVKQRKTVDPVLSPRQRQMARVIQAVAQTDKQALTGFVFPDDQQQLAAYQEKLTAPPGTQPLALVRIFHQPTSVSSRCPKSDVITRRSRDPADQPWFLPELQVTHLQTRGYVRQFAYREISGLESKSPQITAK